MKIKKIILIFIACFCLTGCTKYISDDNNKRIINEETEENIEWELFLIILLIIPMMIKIVINIVYIPTKFRIFSVLSKYIAIPPAPASNGIKKENINNKVIIIRLLGIWLFLIFWWTK